MNGHLTNGNGLCSPMDDLPASTESFQMFNDIAPIRPIPTSMPDLSDIVFMDQHDTSIESMDDEYCPYSPPPMKSPKLNLDYILNSDKLELSPTDLSEIDLLEAELLETLISMDKSIQPGPDPLPATPVVASNRSQRNVPSQRPLESVEERKFTEGLPARLPVRPYESRNDSSRRVSSDSSISTRSAISGSKNFAGSTKCVKSVRVIIPFIGVDQILSKKPKRGSSSSPRGHNGNHNLKKSKRSKSPRRCEVARASCSSKSHLTSEIRGITPDVLAQLISDAIVHLGKSRLLPSFENPAGGGESARRVREASVDSTLAINEADVWRPSNDEKSRLLKWNPTVLSVSFRKFESK